MISPQHTIEVKHDVKDNNVKIFKNHQLLNYDCMALKDKKWLADAGKSLDSILKCHTFVPILNFDNRISVKSIN